MSSPIVPLLAIGALTLGGCASTDKGLVSAHQPVVTATSATVPGCPDWSDADRPVQERMSSNYGCATASNLASMIADPLDLVRGKTDDGSGAGEFAVRAVKAQRDTPPSGKGGAIQQVSARSN